MYFCETPGKYSYLYLMPTGYKLQGFIYLKYNINNGCTKVAILTFIRKIADTVIKHNFVLCCSLTEGF